MEWGSRKEGKSPDPLLCWWGPQILVWGTERHCDPWKLQRSFSLFAVPPCLLLRAISLRVTWKHIPSAAAAGCDTSTKCSLCQQQEEYGNANPGVFFYLPKVQTGHCSFWVWEGHSEWEESFPPLSFLRQQQAQSGFRCHLKASAESPDASKLPTSFLKHRATRTFPLQLLQIL